MFRKVSRVEDDFEKLYIIGKGKFSKVFLVQKRVRKGKEDQPRYYAMKVMKKKWILKLKMVEKITIEQRILRECMGHPFIIGLHLSFQTPEKLIFVLDFCPGGDLYQLIKKNGKLEEDVCKIYAAQIYLAVRFLHQNRIVHRDLKLENCMLDENGNIKLIDFGLSKYVGILRSRMDTQCGTPTYMSPEIIKKKKYDSSTDWWSFGVLLYEILTGYSPFSGRNWGSLKKKILEKKLIFPPNVSLSLEAMDLVSQLLQRDKRQRIRGEDIMNHAFFSDIDFDSLLKGKSLSGTRARKALVGGLNGKQGLNDEPDVSNFNVEKLEEEEEMEMSRSSSEDNDLTEDEKQIFRGKEFSSFSFDADEAEEEKKVSKKRRFSLKALFRLSTPDEPMDRLKLGRKVSSRRNTNNMLGKSKKNAKKFMNLSSCDEEDVLKEMSLRKKGVKIRPIASTETSMTDQSDFSTTSSSFDSEFSEKSSDSQDPISMDGPYIQYKHEII